MKHIQTLTTESFSHILGTLSVTEIWTPYVTVDRLIRLKRIESHNTYSPLTAVYFHLTGEEILNCFWVPEITERFQFHWWEVLEISYASDACNCSRYYDRRLRNQILQALRLPEEKIVAYV